MKFFIYILETSCICDLFFLVSGKGEDVAKRKKTQTKKAGEAEIKTWRDREDPRNLKKQPSEYEVFLEDLNKRVPEGQII